jgi:ribosomal protein L7/L12
MITITVLINIFLLVMVFVWITNWLDRKDRERADRKSAELQIYLEKCQAEEQKNSNVCIANLLEQERAEKVTAALINIDAGNESKLVLVQVSGYVAALKEFRTLTGYEFDEAKQIVDMVRAGGVWVYPGKDLPDFSKSQHLKFEIRGG